MSVLQQNNNVIVKLGKALTTIGSSGTTYQFELVTFDGTRAECLKPGATSLSADTVEAILEAEEDLIVFESMSEAYSGAQSIVGTKAWAEFQKYPCGFVTKNGSIIPQIIIPEKYDDLDNGLDVEGQRSEGSSNGNDTPLNWKCNLDEKRSAIRASNKVGCGYLNMCNQRTSDDETKFSDRVFTADLEEGGSFALMLDFVGNPLIKEGDEKPKTIIDVNADGETTIVCSKTSDVLLTVNGNAPVVGSITSSSCGYDVPHKEGNSEMNPTTVFVYPLYNTLVVTSNLSGSTKDETSLSGRVSDSSYNAFSALDPELKDFPTKFSKSGSQKIEVDTNKRTRFNFADKIKLTWTNSWGSFAYSPILFSRYMNAVYYFKGQSSSNEPAGVSMKYYAVPIFCDNGGDYDVSNASKINASSISTDNLTQSSIYKVEFSMDGNSDSRIPGEIFGFIKVLERKGNYSAVTNDNGNFTMDEPSGTILKDCGRPSSAFVSSSSNPSWVEYITSVQTDINLEEQAGIILSLSQKIEELTELKKEKLQEVRQLMEENNLKELPAGKHTFKLSEILRNSLDMKTMKAKYAELYKALLKSSVYTKMELV